MRVRKPSRSCNALASRCASLAGAGTALLLALSIGPAACAEAPLTAGLKIASWDLTEAPNLIPPPPPPAKTSWRTTFGSERRTRAPPPEPAAAPVIDADAVLLQGVTDARALRRLFPAREWRLVVSRQMLRSSEDTDPVTAVAVRAREGLRVTGREFLLDPTSEGASAFPGGIAAPTAVRLSERGHSVWLLSVALSAGCSAQKAPCPVREKIDTWQRAKGAAGERTITGGKFAGAGAIMLPPPPCFQQSIEASLAGSEHPVVKGKAQEQKGLGCLAVLDVPVD